MYLHFSDFSHQAGNHLIHCSNANEKRIANTVLYTNTDNVNCTLTLFTDYYYQLCFICKSAICKFKTPLAVWDYI